MKDKSIYIGDGVYASYDGHYVWLALNHHEHKVVALEFDVFANLVRFVKSIPNIYPKEETNDQ